MLSFILIPTILIIIIIIIIITDLYSAFRSEDTEALEIQRRLRYRGACCSKPV